MIKWIILGGLAALLVWLATRANKSRQESSFVDSTASWGVQKDQMKNLCITPRTCYAYPTGGRMFFPGINL